MFFTQPSDVVRATILIPTCLVSSEVTVLRRHRGLVYSIPHNSWWGCMVMLWECLNLAASPLLSLSFWLWVPFFFPPSYWLCLHLYVIFDTLILSFTGSVSEVREPTSACLESVNGCLDTSLWRVTWWGWADNITGSGEWVNWKISFLNTVNFDYIQ